MTTMFNVDELVPHSSAMSLLSRVVGYGDDWLEAEVDIDAQSLFAQADGVPSYVGLAYMAQAIAAYAGLQERKAQQPPKIGFLLGTRRYEVSKPYFPCGVTLTVRVEREMVAENGLHAFKGNLYGDQVDASANLNVFQPDDANAFIKEMKK
jgi:predicted hotdog family 3-hydroxylacyl-ACP dehydratase